MWVDPFHSISEWNSNARKSDDWESAEPIAVAAPIDSPSPSSETTNYKAIGLTTTVVASSSTGSGFSTVVIPPKIQLMRRPPKTDKSSDSPPPKVVPEECVPSLTLQEREAAYDAAKARIYSSQSSWSLEIGNQVSLTTIMPNECTCILLWKPHRMLST